ncbi:arginine--tRNA ligase [Candidatus Peregrinibacteria bacterium RIFOXYB12_FULL_41_12]|nr:MAG: arginine--tRNA ligase [Candidatus Peregrinibacteria bacterium RIFOXYA2_FULL_41_18]OGJ49031.1 MAG: arginine--tRNA ligase [Candidatus Peregrinibacteria bacterium RIFOXYB12_FULL_41_12]
MITEQLQQLVSDSLVKAGLEFKGKILIEKPADKSHGDFSTPIALQMAREIGKNPREVATQIVNGVEKGEIVESIDIAGPGFINFRLSKQVLEGQILEVKKRKEKFGRGGSLKGKKIMIEFAHPNTHKAFHIGHLRNISLGESLVRIIKSQGAKVFRANYQGDIGLHVAKCLWGYSQSAEKIGDDATPQQKAEFLGKVYAVGGKAFEADEQARAEIYAINKKIYAHDPEIMPLWEKTRKWSLEYFDYIYKRLGTHFDRLFFESEVFELGRSLVEKFKAKGVFEDSQEAVIFPGEKYGLHNRVFITKDGNPTYEAKEMGLAKLEREAFKFDKNIHVVANEQADYLKVTFKAMDFLFPGILQKQFHLSYGMVNLTTGKMSSRTGDVITAESLIGEAREKIGAIVAESKLTAEEKELATEKVAVGAIKFMMLFANAKGDIAFDINKAVKLDGDSGPYLQYAFARISSITSKVKSKNKPNFGAFNEADWNLTRCLNMFEYTIAKAAEELSPHGLAHYLLELASEFSKWYAVNTVKDAEGGLKAARLTLIKAVAQVLKNGLELMGIEVVEKM